jgi:transposase
VEDKSQEEVCKIFNCSRRSLMRWVEKYKTDGKITGYERTPKAYKVHKEHVDFYYKKLRKTKPLPLKIYYIYRKTKPLPLKYGNVGDRIFTQQLWNNDGDMTLNESPQLRRLFNL